MENELLIHTIVHIFQGSMSYMVSKFITFCLQISNDVGYPQNTFGCWPTAVQQFTSGDVTATY